MYPDFEWLSKECNSGITKRKIEHTTKKHEIKWYHVMKKQKGNKPPGLH